jgi:hypothetical protein
MPPNSTAFPSSRATKVDISQSARRGQGSDANALTKLTKSSTPVILVLMPETHFPNAFGKVHIHTSEKPLL